ncbi:MAG UNVERIFIED_CONTAM: hypothetical protein LVR18_11930 [Planctomycetaceae bacterium]|jgi:hypothetical protein
MAVTAEQSSRRRRLGTLALVILVATTGWLYDYSVRAERDREASRIREGKLLAERFLASPDVFLDDLATHRDIALPILKDAYSESKQSTTGAGTRQKLHAAYGLARYQPTPELLEVLTEEVATLDASEFVMMQLRPAGTAQGAAATGRSVCANAAAAGGGQETALHRNAAGC